MTPADWDELAARCQKPDFRNVGNWYARRISRPLALRVTWLILPTGVSAHTITILAWLVALVAAALLAAPSSASFLIAVALLQLWYLLDHVDGQIARYHGTASLDGVALDYTMHHTINLLVPLAVGYRIGQTYEQQVWLLAGVAWGLGSLLLGLDHDVRTKAMAQRLKRLHGELRVVGGGGGRPQPAAGAPSTLLRRTAWLARKACETHVVMNSLAIIAGVEAVLATSRVSAIYLAAISPPALALAARQIGRNLQSEAAEREFAAWFRVPEGYELTCENGWWLVTSAQAAEAGHAENAEPVSSPPVRA